MFDLYESVDPPRRDASRITIVDIDGETVRQVGRWPFPRERLARLVDRARGARVIGLDILSLDADQASAAGSDARLACAIADDRVVLAATAGDEDGADAIPVTPILQSDDGAQPLLTAVPHVAWPFPSLARQSSGIGSRWSFPKATGSGFAEARNRRVDVTIR